VASTELTAPDAAAAVMTLQGGAGSLIRDLTVALPANLPASPFSVGLSIADPALNVAVESDPTNTQAHVGVNIGAGGSLTGSTVVLSQAIGNVTGAQIDGASGVPLANTTIVARNGVAVLDPGASVIERVDITSEATAVGSAGPGVTVRSSILRPIQGGTGASVIDQSFDADLMLDGVTILGDGSPSSTGAAATNFFGGHTASVTRKSSIVRNVARSMMLEASNAAGAATATALYSDYDPAAVTIVDGLGVETATPASGLLEPGANLNVDPLFTNPPSDPSLSAASALIDRGDPATAGGLDFSGGALVTDGDGDGTARRDVGANERPGVPSSAGGIGGGAGTDVLAASISGFRAVPKRFAVVKRKAKAAARRGTKFRWRLDEAAAVTLTVARALPGRRKAGACRRPTRRNRDRRRCIRYRSVGRLNANGVPGPNSRAFGGRFKRRALRPGPYRALIGAVDAAGNISKPRATRFKVLRPS
jgi:hypothetical protein